MQRQKLVLGKVTVWHAAVHSHLQPAKWQWVQFMHSAAVEQLVLVYAPATHVSSEVVDL